MSGSCEKAQKSEKHYICFLRLPSRQDLRTNPGKGRVIPLLGSILFSRNSRPNVKDRNMEGRKSYNLPDEDERNRQSGDLKCVDRTVAHIASSCRTQD
ncbi:hypothetical protein OESDEN_12629 [Oesophagostomum dentatum]|uniref:Uncharacterized protein n=1 Tax=Oesophagostomum dentatum TaxID=61180 RepID=A0A0B1SRM7_OESDE|nr:hypothetical protein OESDEN_12629 [Oesophagostomum dentatum]